MTATKALLLVLLTYGPSDQVGRAEPVSGFALEVLLREDTQQPWARIRNQRDVAQMVCLHGVTYTDNARSGGGSGFMGHRCQKESAYAVVLPNESYVAELTDLPAWDGELTVSVTMETRTWSGSESTGPPSRATVTWRGTRAAAQEAYRRVSGRGGP